MECFLIKVTPAEETNHESPLTMVSLSYKDALKLKQLLEVIDLETIDSSFNLNPSICDLYWIDFIDEFIECSAETASEIEAIVDSDELCTEYQLNIESGVAVENSQIVVTSDGVFFACELDKQTFYSSVLGIEQFEYLENCNNAMLSE